MTTLLPCLVPLFVSGFSFSSNTGIALSGISGFFAGISFGGALTLAFELYKKTGLSLFLGIVAAAFFMALLVFWFFGWLFMSDPFRPLVVVFPLVALVFYYVSIRRGYPKRSETPRHGRVVNASGRRALQVFVFFSTFLLIYMTAMFPKTTQLAPEFYENVLRGTSLNTYIMLLLSSALLIFVCVLLSKRWRYTFVGVLIAIGLFAAIFYSLPSMSTGALPLMLITPCALLFTLLAFLLLLSEADLSVSKSGRSQRMRTGFIASAMGGIIAAGFSALFMGPLYGAITFQDTLFVIIPASVLVILVALLMPLRAKCEVLFFPDAMHKESIDVSSMEGRCHIIADSFGLTKRETEVLCLLSAGRNEPWIEEMLGVSRATVKTHISHIYQKTGVSSRQELLDLLYSK
ncbi:MAG: LuxR C-terminal-related transcriptional regulator [Coriobacteriales bacterium]|nr:LuxR C-terminal-related transcriptional regulator [Coriobacteriales bacterium]